MKKSLLILVLLLTFKVIAQQDSIQKTPSNEIKINVFNLIVFKAADLSYEYLLNENQSVGASLFYQSNDNEKLCYGNDIELRDFSVTPYYRHYFSKKYAKGFFMEGFAMYSTGKIKDYNDIYYRTKRYTNFYIGVVTGVKLVSKNGFALDIYFGLGRAIYESSINIEITTRGGVSLGYRF